MNNGKSITSHQMGLKNCHFKCTERHAVEYFLSQLTLSSTKILIGGVEPSLCRVASQLAEKYEKLLILWSCLEVPTSEEHRFTFESTGNTQHDDASIYNKTSDTNYNKEADNHGYVALVTPVANQVARSVRAALQHLGWRRISIVTIDSRYWMGVTQVLDAELRAWRHLVPAIQVLPSDYTEQKIVNLIKNVMSQRVKAFLLVLPSSSPIVGHVLRIAGREGLTKQTALILVDPLLEPQSQFFSVKANISATSEGLSVSAPDNETDDSSGETESNLLSTASYNRTKLITKLTEHDLIEMKKKHLEEQIKLKELKFLEKRKHLDKQKLVNQFLVNSGKSSNRKRAKRTKELKSDIRNSLAESEELGSVSIHDNQSINNTDRATLDQSNYDDVNQNITDSSEEESDSESDTREDDVAKNLIFKAPRQLSSLPIEVARSVLVSVSKSVGFHEGGYGDDYMIETDDQNYDFGGCQNEDDATVSRLAFDSVSLASHILRRNVGVIHLKRKKKKKRRKKSFWEFSSFNHKIPPDPNRDSQAPEGVKRNPSSQTEPSTSTWESDPSTTATTGEFNSLPVTEGDSDPKWNYDSVLHPSLLTKINSKRCRKWTSDPYPKTSRNCDLNRLKRDTVDPSALRQDDQRRVRDQIYLEVKRLQEHGDRSAEERLQNILVGNIPSSERTFTVKRIPKLDTWRSTFKVVARVTQPTYFGAFRGDGLVLSSGKRTFEFLLLDWRPSMEALVPVLRIHETNYLDNEDSNVSVKVEVLADIDWAFDVPIPSDPICELLGMPCVAQSVLALAPAYVALIVASLVVVTVGCCTATVFIRNYLRQKALSKGPYKILLNSGDITLSARSEAAPRKIGSPTLGERPDLLRGGHLVAPAPKVSPNNRLHPNAARVSLREADAIRAKYNGDFVHMRYFYSPGNFEVKNKTMSLLKQMHELRHENINSFLGLLCDPVRPGFVFDYSQRGSLEDIIKQKDIKLDWSFKLSLLTDLVRGLRYLHSSPLKVHGRLTSRNCVIDARWVLKVTDYGLGSVYEVQNIPHPMRSNRDLLWKAPELLRVENLLTKGTQMGDVFSFAIIMQEVIIRGAPYCMVQLTHPEIIARLKKPPPMIRPSVSKGAAPPDVINIMKQCWAELPDMRPDFNQIYDQFKKLNQGRRLNIVDTMFQMLEKYSSNLEDLIRERTEQLHVEKKKTEQLLNRMLPSTVADQLKLGKPVAPEEFDEVTIYFSDIVGFTTISAYSTPFEVVDLLNDLYTAFDATINHYNVYKVETIGDAYMVVGGVPCRIEDHASQIATMALDLLHLSGKFRIRHLHDIPLMLRIGIHTGPCCAGVVGVTMPRYCLFGDTVNTASRMESTGSAWRIHVSETTAVKLREVGGYKLDFRGRTQLKGKGLMPTYWLLGKDNFNKELPVPPEVGHSHGLDEELVKQGRQHYATRRDSTHEVMASAIKIYNQNRQQQQIHSEEEPVRLNCPPSPFYSGLLPDKRSKRMMKQCPIIVKIENVDGGSCENIDLLRMSPLPQSPDNESCFMDGNTYERSLSLRPYERTLKPGERTLSIKRKDRSLKNNESASEDAICSGFGISYSGFNNVSKYNSSNDFVIHIDDSNKSANSNTLGPTILLQGNSLNIEGLRRDSICFIANRETGSLEADTQVSYETENNVVSNMPINVIYGLENMIFSEAPEDLEVQDILAMETSKETNQNEAKQEPNIITIVMESEQTNEESVKKRKVSNDKAKPKDEDKIKNLNINEKSESQPFARGLLSTKPESQPPSNVFLSTRPESQPPSNVFLSTKLESQLFSEELISSKQDRQLPSEGLICTNQETTSGLTSELGNETKNLQMNSEVSGVVERKKRSEENKTKEEKPSKEKKRSREEKHSKDQEKGKEEKINRELITNNEMVQIEIPYLVIKKDSAADQDSQIQLGKEERKRKGPKKESKDIRDNLKVERSGNKKTSDKHRNETCTKDRKEDRNPKELGVKDSGERRGDNNVRVERKSNQEPSDKSVERRNEKESVEKDKVEHRVNKEISVNVEIERKGHKELGDKHRRGQRDNKKRKELPPEDKERKELALEDKGRRELAPEDKGRSEVAPEDKGRKELAPGDKGRLEIPPEDKGRREVALGDKGRKELPLEDKGRSEVALGDKGRKELPPEDKGRRELVPEDKGRRELVSEDKGRKELALGDKGRKELTPEGRTKKSKSEKRSRSRGPLAKDAERSSRSRSSSPIKEDRRKKDRKHVKRESSPTHEQVGAINVAGSLPPCPSRSIQDPNKPALFLQPSSVDITKHDTQIIHKSVIGDKLQGRRIHSREPNTYQNFYLEDVAHGSSREYRYDKTDTVSRSNVHKPSSFQLHSMELPSPTESTML